MPSLASHLLLSNRSSRKGAFHSLSLFQALQGELLLWLLRMKPREPVLWTRTGHFFPSLFFHTVRRGYSLLLCI